MPTKKRSDVQRAGIAALVKRGRFSTGRIGRRFGITNSNVMSIALKSKTFTPRVLRISPYKKKMAVELSEQGISEEEIARTIGVSKSKVWAIVHGEKARSKFQTEKEITAIVELPESQRLKKYLNLIVLQHTLLLNARNRRPEFGKRIERLSAQTAEISRSFSEANKPAVLGAAQMLLDRLK